MCVPYLCTSFLPLLFIPFTPIFFVRFVSFGCHSCFSLSPRGFRAFDIAFAMRGFGTLTVEVASRTRRARVGDKKRDAHSLPQAPCVSTASPCTLFYMACADRVWTKCCVSLDCAATEVTTVLSRRPQRVSSRWPKWQEGCGFANSASSFASGLLRRSCHGLSRARTRSHLLHSTVTVLSLWFPCLPPPSPLIVCTSILLEP